MRLQDKVTFTSGGARGIGAAIARLFAAEGARVAFGDVLEQDVEGEERGQAHLGCVVSTDRGDRRTARPRAMPRGIGPSPQSP